MEWQIFRQNLRHEHSTHANHAMRMIQMTQREVPAVSVCNVRNNECKISSMYSLYSRIGYDCIPSLSCGHHYCSHFVAVSACTILWSSNNKGVSLQVAGSKLLEVW